MELYGLYNIVENVLVIFRRLYYYIIFVTCLYTVSNADEESKIIYIYISYVKLYIYIILIIYIYRDIS